MPPRRNIVEPKRNKEGFRVKQLSQKGFSAVEGLIILILVGLVGFTGWFVWHSQQTASKTLDDTNMRTAKDDAPKNLNSSSNPESEAQPVASQDFLIIKEWGVKLPMKNPEKVSYVYSIEGGDDLPRQIMAIDSSVYFRIKEEYLKDPMCRDAQVGYVRSKSEASTTSSTNYSHVGEYYFYVVGGPEHCPGPDAAIQINIIDSQAKYKLQPF